MGSAPVMGFCVPENRDCGRSCAPLSSTEWSSVPGQNLRRQFLIVKVISELILLNIRPHSESELERKRLWVLVFPSWRSAMCSIVCSAGYSHNTAGWKTAILSPLSPLSLLSLLSLLAAVNLRKYNHSLLPQLPAELQTRAVGRRAVQTLQRASVSVGAQTRRLSCVTAWKSSAWGPSACVPNGCDHTGVPAAAKHYFIINSSAGCLYQSVVKYDHFSDSKEKWILLSHICCVYLFIYSREKPENVWQLCLINDWNN